MQPNDLTPRDVIDHFKTSPTLRGYARDLERQFKHQGMLDGEWGHEKSGNPDPNPHVPTAEAGGSGDIDETAGVIERPHEEWGQDIDAGKSQASPQMGQKTLQVSGSASPQESMSYGLMDRLMAVIDALIGLERRVKRGYLEMGKLLEEGLTDATVHWRKDAAGERTILELLHPTGSTYETQNGRRREYIGKDPQKIAEARARIRRFHQYQRLQGQVWQDDRKVKTIKARIDALELMAQAVQQELPNMGTPGAAAEEISVPTGRKE